MHILNTWVALGLLSLGFLLGASVDTLRWRKRCRAISARLKYLKQVNDVLMRY